MKISEVVGAFAAKLREKAEELRGNPHYHNHTHYQTSDTLEVLADAMDDLACELDQAAF